MQTLASEPRLSFRYSAAVSEDLSAVMAEYKYSPLTGSSIRLVKLLPGGPEEKIRIIIDKADLVANTSVPPEACPLRMTSEELKTTLPADWWVYETVEDDIYFYYETVNVNTGEKTWKTSWTHPDPTVDPSLYRKPESISTATPGFEALSYTWRSENPDEDCIVRDGSEQSSSTFLLRLGGNLASALRHLRQRDTMRTLWIDAICINQGDLKEREEQVSRMANIYNLASRVVVWLGVGSEDSDLAIHKLDYLGKQLILTKDNWIFSTPDSEEPFWCEGAYRVPYTEEVWTSINKLLTRAWFNRVWIIQEIQLAKHGAVIQCGWQQMTWSHFRNAISCLWVSVSRKIMICPLAGFL